MYITVPTLDQIEAAHGTSIGLTDYTGTGMTVRAQHGSSVKGVVHLQQLTITAEHGAYVNLSGEATGLTVKAQHGSRVSADELIATNETVDAAHGSSLFVNVTDTLRATSQHGSRIRYANQPKQIIGNTVEQNIRPVAPEAPEFE